MRNHYVPQFLLRPWAESSSDGKIEVFRLDLTHLPSSRRGTRYTGYEQDLYALTKANVAGMDQHATEKVFLRDVDNRAALVHSKLTIRGLASLTKDERNDWACFIMSLRLRQPQMIRYLRTEAAAELRRNLATEPVEYDELAGMEDPPTLEEWTEARYPGLVENFGLSFFHKLVDNPQIGTKILRMKWWLWDLSDAPHELLLGDHPCIFTSGIDDPNLLIALPLSPRKAFIATQNDAVASKLRPIHPRDLAVAINESTIGQAATRVYATDGSATRFIHKRLSRPPIQQKDQLDHRDCFALGIATGRERACGCSSG